MSAPINNIPSNSTLIRSLDKEVDTLNRVERDPALSYKGERVVEDVKRIIEDQKALIQEKNNGDNIQRLAKDGYLMALGLANDPRFGSPFENWGAILASAARSGDWTEISRTLGSFATDLRETESFINLLNELQTTIKLLIAQKIDQNASRAENFAHTAVGGVRAATQTAENAGVIRGESKVNAQDAAHRAADRTEHAADKARSLAHSASGLSNSTEPVSDEEYKRKQDKHRKKALHQLNLTLQQLSNNPTWRLMISKTKSAGSVVKSEGASAGHLLSTLKDDPRAQEVVLDLAATLQNLVGSQMSVEPFFNYTMNATKYILRDQSFFELLSASQGQLSRIADQPALMEDQYTQDDLRALGIQFEAKLQELHDNPDVQGARSESQKILACIMNDPLSAKLVDDTRTLIKHLHSLKPGQALDPALLAEMRGVIVPLILEHLKDVPVPPVHDVAESALGRFEYDLRDIHISAKALIPDNIRIKFKYDLNAQPMALSYQKQNFHILLKAKDIQLHIKDVAWSYRRLTTPHLHDDGHMSLQTQGQGVSLRLKMDVKSMNETHTNTAGQTVHQKDTFNVLESGCHIDRWSVHFSDSKHDKLYEMLNGLFGGRIRKQIEDMISSKMREFASIFNHKVYVLYNEAQIKREEAKYWASAKKDNMTTGWQNAKQDVKDSIKERIVESDTYGSLKDAAYEKGKEAVKIGLERASNAPSLGAAVADLSLQAREALEGSDLLQSVKEKASDLTEAAKDKAGDLTEAAKDKAADLKAGDEYEDRSNYIKVPLSFREYAPVPAATFVSADPSDDSHMGDISSKAKYPDSVISGPKKSHQQEQKSITPSQ